MSEETARAERRLPAEARAARTRRAPHVLRRRNAAELPGAEVRRSPTRASARPSSARQSTSASRRTRRCSSRRSSSSSPRTTSASRSRSTARASMQDKFRVFHNGTGSYDVVAPKIKELLRRHRSRPIGARVTLTSDTLDITRDLPAPDRGDRLLGSRLRAGDDVAAARVRDRRRTASTAMLDQFRALAAEFLEHVASRTGTTASRTSRTRSRRFTRA